jgi:plasmid stabilization system protein ParE
VILPLIITGEAEVDLAEAKAWYERQRVGLGVEFVENVQQCLQRNIDMPLAFGEEFPGVRCAIVRRFPYGIYYRADADRIAVIAVYHSKRDPRGWQERAANG